MPDCIISKKNIGASKCTRLPNLPKYMITTPNNFSITPATLATAALLKTALQTAIKASKDARIYIWPKFSSFEDQSEQTLYVQTPLGSRKVRDGQYRFKFGVSKDLCVHKAMFTHAAQADGRVILVDFQNRILLTKDVAGNYRGMSVDLLNVEKLKISDGNGLTETPVYVSLNDNLELDSAGELFDAGAAVVELDPLTDAEILLAGTLSTTIITVSVKNVCDGVPVSGLVLADFLIRNAAGVVQVPTSVTEPASDGVYVLTRSTTYTSGAGTTVRLRDASLVTVSAYESADPLTVTIP